MTNGKMEESINRRALIPDHDPETFALFAKFAYMGICGLADGIGPAPPRALEVTPTPPRQYQCVFCGIHRKLHGNAHYPFCRQGCRTMYQASSGRVLGDFGPIQSQGLYCVVIGCSSRQLVGSVGCLCPAHVGVETETEWPPFRASVHAPVPQVKSTKTTTYCTSTFLERSYRYQGFPQHVVNHHIQSHLGPLDESGEVIRRSLVSHAKLYALADKYMVDDLPDLCLHLLHRDLTRLELDATTINEVIALVTYTYDNTSDAGEIRAGTTDRMRSLVMAFIEDRTDSLMKYKDFQTVFAAGGRHTADFLAITFG